MKPIVRCARVPAALALAAALVGCTTLTEQQRVALTDAGVKFAVLGVKKLNELDHTNVVIPAKYAETALLVCDYLNGEGAEFSDIVFELAADQINAALISRDPEIPADNLASASGIRGHMNTVCEAIEALMADPEALKALDEVPAEVAPEVSPVPAPKPATPTEPAV